MSEWKDISTAPRDGSVIISNDGTCKWSDGQRAGWFLCDANGCIPKDDYFGCEISEIMPTAWLPLKKDKCHSFTGPETIQVNDVSN
jgi:hypothetical protein